MTLSAALVLLALGVLLGYWLGRARAEWGRAMHDMDAARRGRRRYRR